MEAEEAVWRLARSKLSPEVTAFESSRYMFCKEEKQLPANHAIPWELM